MGAVVLVSKNHVDGLKTVNGPGLNSDLLCLFSNIFNLTEAALENSKTSKCLCLRAVSARVRRAAECGLQPA